jgi:hypothetical protein
MRFSSWRVLASFVVDDLGQGMAIIIRTMKLSMGSVLAQREGLR